MNGSDAIVTIIIPCYNQAKFLYESLQSLRSQSLQQWKAVVIDDAAPDADEIDRIVNQLGDGRIMVVRHEVNKGLAAARNTGFRAAETEWVYELDADDKLDPGCLMRLVQEAQAHPDANAVSSDFQFFGDCTGVYAFSYTGLAEELLETTIPGPGVLTRKSLWVSAGGYCEDPMLRLGCEDREFWIAAIAAGLNIRQIHEPLYHYRRHGESMVTKMGFHMYKLHRYVYNRHRRAIDACHMGPAYVAQGYWISAVSFRRTRRLLLAVWLGLQACAITRQKTDVRRLFNLLARY